MMIELLQDAAATVPILGAVLFAGALCLAWMTGRFERPAQVVVRSSSRKSHRGACLREDSRDRRHR